MLKKVLIVDDDAQFGEFLLFALSELGFSASYANGGKGGLALLRSESFDLVLTDLHMPEMDGFEFIKEIRLTAPHLKIIVMSGGGVAGSPFPSLRAAKFLGAFNILAKPFSFDELSIALKAALAES